MAPTGSGVPVGFSSEAKNCCLFVFPSWEDPVFVRKAENAKILSRINFDCERETVRFCAFFVRIFQLCATRIP